MSGRVESVIDRYRPAARRLGAQPKTLVHNDLAAKNVLVDRSVDPARVCFVDWEMAGAGCGLLDLVTFKHGLDEANDRAMTEAYYEGVYDTVLAEGGANERSALLAACSLHKVFVFLWRNRVWQLPRERVMRWIDEAERLVAEIERQEGGACGS